MFKWMLSGLFGLGVAIAIGQMSQSGAGAAGSCTCVAVTPPAGTVYATTGFSSSIANQGGGDAVAFNATAGPDCTVDAMKFTEGTANALHSALVSGAEITNSFSGSVDIIVFLKQGSGTRNVNISMADPTFAFVTSATVNPSTGAIVTAASTNFSGASAWVTTGVPTSNGFWMFVLHTSNISQSGINWQLFSASGATVTYTGNGTSFWYGWGGAVFSP